MARIRRRTILLAGILILAAGIRLTALGDPAVTFDEHVYAGTGMDRVTTLDPESFVWSDELHSFIDNPPLAFFYYGIWGHIGSFMGGTGYSGMIWWARLGGVVLGLVLVFLTFRIAEMLLGDRPAAVAALVVALLPQTVGWSRIAYIEGPIIVAYALAIFSFLRTHQTVLGRRLLLLGGATGVAFATKYTGVFVAPLLASLVVLYASRPVLPRLGVDYNLDGWNADIADFMVLSTMFGLAALAVLTAVFPYLWTDPIGGFAHILGRESGRGSLTLIGGLKGLFQMMIGAAIRIPGAALLLAGIGAVIGIIRGSRDTTLLLLWTAAPLLLGVLGFSNPKYAVPGVVPIAILSAAGLMYVVRRWMPGLDGWEMWIASATLGVYLLFQTATAFPVPADSYYGETVGMTGGAFEQASNDGAIDGPIGLGAGGGKGVMYIYRNAEPGASVQLYVQPQPFYIGIDRSLTYVDPTKYPTADYVVLNNLYVLRDKQTPKWWWTVTGRQYNGTDHSLSYAAMEDDPSYEEEWSYNMLGGTPLAKVYRRNQ